jgi:hypothetical protein
MKNLTKTFLAILLFFISSVSIANTPSISVDLLSYEQKDDHCALTYSILNNSWGTIYGLRITTEAFDDRDTKLDEYLFGSSINPFAGWWDELVSIPLGSQTTGSDLKYEGQCKYIGTINLLGVDSSDCNIRMMPEQARCFDIIEFNSKIDHISFNKK